jgi:hypothetical protein
VASLQTGRLKARNLEEGIRGRQRMPLLVSLGHVLHFGRIFLAIQVPSILAGVRVVFLESLTEPKGLSKALGLLSRSLEMLAYRGILDRLTGDRAIKLQQVN